jgi:hypothetical protein
VEGQPFPLTAHFFLLLFTVLVSIILMNLLVGLAVSDIQGLSKSAKLDQLIQQVWKLVYCGRDAWKCPINKRKYCICISKFQTGLLTDQISRGVSPTSMRNRV